MLFSPAGASFIIMKRDHLVCAWDSVRAVPRGPTKGKLFCLSMYGYYFVKSRHHQYFLCKLFARGFFQKRIKCCILLQRKSNLTTLERRPCRPKKRTRGNGYWHALNRGASYVISRGPRIFRVDLLLIKAGLKLVRILNHLPAHQPYLPIYMHGLERTSQPSFQTSKHPCFECTNTVTMKKSLTFNNR